LSLGVGTTGLATAPFTSPLHASTEGLVPLPTFGVPRHPLGIFRLTTPRESPDTQEEPEEQP
jgi:hypothetical protein